MKCFKQPQLVILLFLSFSIILPTCVVAQKTDTIYTNQGKLHQVITTDGDKKTIQTFNYGGRLIKLETLVNNEKQGEFKEYYDNGKPKTVANYNQGQLEGSFTAYRKNGNLQAVMNYKIFEVNGRLEGLKDGMAKLYHFNGGISAEGRYQKGLQEGTWKTYNQQGQVMEQKELKAGKMAGTHIQYHRNGQIQYEADVYEDVTVNNVYHAKLVKGWVKRYFENGNPEQFQELADGKPTGNEKRWWENGQLRFEGSLISTGQRESKYFDQTGDLTLYLEEKQSMVKGYMRWVKDGLEKRYKGNVLLSETNYKDGKGHGAYKHYNEQGVLVAEGNSHKQKQIGTFKSYHNNGKLKDISTTEFIFYWHGDTGIVKNGWQKRFFENGQTDYESLTDMGEEIYTARYDEKGNLLSRTFHIQTIRWNQEYYPGGILKSDNFNGYYYSQNAVWFINGKPQSVIAKSHYPQETTFEYAYDGAGNLTKAKVDGEQISLNEVESAYQFEMNESFYKAKVSDGTYKLNYDNGQRRVEIDIEDGLPNGAIKVYRQDGTLALYAEVQKGLSRGLSLYLSPQGDTIAQEIRGPGKEKKMKTWSSDSSYREGNYDQKGNRLYYYETHPGGSPKLLEDHTNRIFKRWMPNGQLTSESKPVGEGSDRTVHKNYFESGQLRQKYFQVGVEREGEFWLYHENGKLYVHCFYKNGKQHGTFERFNEEGKLHSSGELIKGKKEGFWLVLVDGEYVEQFYKNDRRQVSLPQNTCACIDTVQAVGQLQFVPTVRHLIDYRKYKNSHFSFIQAMSEERYNSLFYRSLVGKGLDLLSFKALTLNFDEAGENTLTLNRCHTRGYLSAMDMNWFNRGDGYVLSIYEPDLKLAFAHDIMYQQEDRGNIRINISPKSAEFSERKYIETEKMFEEACFEPIKLGGWQLDDAQVHLIPNMKALDANELFSYEIYNLYKLPNIPKDLQTITVEKVRRPIHGMPDTVSKKVFTPDFIKQRLTGFVAVQGTGSFTFKGEKLPFYLRYLWLTNNWGSGSFDIKLDKIKKDDIVIETASGEKINSTIQELKELLLAAGFHSVEIQQYTNQRKLKIEFWVQ